MVIELLAEAIAKSSDSKGILLDGFPANLEQAQLFEKMVGAPGKIVVFDLNEELIKLRLKERSNFDDQEEAVLKRINTYNEKTKPVVASYSVIKVMEKLIELIDVIFQVNADQDKEAVFSDICKIMDS